RTGVDVVERVDDLLLLAHRCERSPVAARATVVVGTLRVGLPVGWRRIVLDRLVDEVAADAQPGERDECEHLYRNPAAATLAVRGLAQLASGGAALVGAGRQRPVRRVGVVVLLRL